MVRDIIIASSSDKVRAQLRGFVAEMGIMGVIECRSASQTLDFTQRLPSAIIICHRLTDMAPAAMLRLLPPRRYDIAYILRPVPDVRYEQRAVHDPAALTS